MNVVGLGWLVVDNQPQRAQPQVGRGRGLAKAAGWGLPLVDNLVLPQAGEMRWGVLGVQHHVLG